MVYIVTRGLALNSTPPLPVWDLSTTVRTRGQYDISLVNGLIKVALVLYMILTLVDHPHLSSRRYVSAITIEMADQPLLEELYAPDTVRVSRKNKTNAYVR